MKRPKLIVSTALAGLVALPLAAFAGPMKGDGHTRHRSFDNVAKYDTNGDGKLDKAEWMAARADRKATMLAKYDTNGDGTLDPSERKVMRADRRAKKAKRVAERFAKLDSNGDGVISKTEAGPRLSKHFDRIDKNQDGVLSKSELASKRKGKRWGKRGNHRKGNKPNK